MRPGSSSPIGYALNKPPAAASISEERFHSQLEKPGCRVIDAAEAPGDPVSDALAAEANTLARVRWRQSVPYPAGHGDKSSLDADSFSGPVLVPGLQALRARRRRRNLK